MPVVMGQVEGVSRVVFDGMINVVEGEFCLFGRATAIFVFRNDLGSMTGDFGDLDSDGAEFRFDGFDATWK